jgi:hypothetical protein
VIEKPVDLFSTDLFHCAPASRWVCLLKGQTVRQTLTGLIIANNLP